MALAGWPGDAGLVAAGCTVLAGTPITGVAAVRTEDAAGLAGWAAHAVVSTVSSAAAASASRPPACPPRGAA